MPRNALWILMALGVSAAACSVQTATPGATTSSSATAAKSTSLHYFTIVGTDLRDIPLKLALDALKAQGYSVDETDLSSSTLLLQALARGDADIASFNNQTAWDAVAKGTPLRTVMSKYVTSPLVGAAQEVKTCADLDGKSVALASTAGVTTSLFNMYLKLNCPASKPQVVMMADTHARAAALLSGQIDAAQLEPQDMVQLQITAPGRFHTFVALGQAFPQVQSSGIHVRPDWAAQHSGPLKDFMRTLLLANRQVTANPAVLVDEGVKRLGLDPTAAKETAAIQLGYDTWDANGGLTPENVKYTLDFLAQSDPALARLKVEDVTDFSYLNTVLDEIGRK